MLNVDATHSRRELTEGVGIITLLFTDKKTQGQKDSATSAWKASPQVFPRLWLSQPKGHVLIEGVPDHQSSIRPNPAPSIAVNPISLYSKHLSVPKMSVLGRSVVSLSESA